MKDRVGGGVGRADSRSQDALGRKELPVDRRMRGILAGALPVAVALWIGVGQPRAQGDVHPRGGRVAAGLAGHDAKPVPPPTPIGGSSTAQYRSTYTLKGRTGGPESARIAGVVTLRGRWNNGAWAELGRTRTDALGRYQIAIVLGRRGTLELRLLTPDGATFTKTLRVG
jgi:hypothetical protein